MNCEVSRFGRLTLCAIASLGWGLLVVTAGILIPSDAGWALEALGWLAILASPYVAAQSLRPWIPQPMKARWVVFVTLGGWTSTVSVAVFMDGLTRPEGAAIAFAVAVGLAGPFGGGFAALRSWMPPG